VVSMPAVIHRICLMTAAWEFMTEVKFINFDLQNDNTNKVSTYLYTKFKYQ